MWWRVTLDKERPFISTFHPFEKQRGPVRKHCPPNLTVQQCREERADRARDIHQRETQEGKP